MTSNLTKYYYYFKNNAFLIIIVVFSFLTIGCSNSRVFYGERNSNDMGNNRVQLIMYNDGLVVFSIYKKNFHRPYTGKYNVFYYEEFFKYNKTDKNKVRLEPYRLDKYNFPITIDCHKTKDTSCIVEMKELSPYYNWFLVSLTDTIKVNKGDVLSVDTKPIAYKLYGIIKNDSIFCENDTISTEKFILTRNCKNIITMDCRLYGFPFVSDYNQYDDIMFLSKKIIQIERRRHVFIKCKKEKLQRNAVVNEMIKNQR